MRAKINCGCGYRMTAEFPDPQDTQSLSFHCPNCSRPQTLEVRVPRWISAAKEPEEQEVLSTCKACGGPLESYFQIGKQMWRCVNRCRSRVPSTITT